MWSFGSADRSLDGYEYQGKVQFREGRAMTRPHLKADSMEQLQAEAAASLDGVVHYTTLITSDGHQYRKRCCSWQPHGMAVSICYWTSLLSVCCCHSQSRLTWALWKPAQSAVQS